MRLMVVGGNPEKRKPSSVIYKLTEILQKEAKIGYQVYNGIKPRQEHMKGNDLIIWAPDVSNEKTKEYPIKDKGAVLICSKVIHGDRTEVDAISRIFSMHGNAVICIYKEKSHFRFKLIDALGNVWSDTHYINVLCESIMRFYKWSKGQIRESLKQEDLIQTSMPVKVGISEEFIKLNTILADKVENSLGSRYFGNFSTRCMKLFPSMKLKDNYYMFSPRNTDKRRLKPDDFVLIKPPFYYGERKPSVDTPVQVKIYEKFENINFMIHGHAFIENSMTTKNYFPCGDLREVDEIINLFIYGYRFINLKNHGFLMATQSIETMEYWINKLDFKVNQFLRVD